jgi:rhomboid family GlyGly-CTERM serine protease
MNDLSKTLKINKTVFVNVVLCPLLFFLLALTIVAFKPEGPALFRYDFYDIQNGEWWRFISAHLTHNTWNHFFLNMLGLAIMAYLFMAVATWQRWLIIMIGGSVFSSTCFYFLKSEDYNYVGMSDVLHGVIIAFAMLDYKNFKLGSLILIAGTIGKVIWEQSPWYIETSGEFIGGRVAIDSHLYGTIAGLVFGCLFLLIEMKKPNSPKSEQTDQS